MNECSEEFWDIYNIDCNPTGKKVKRGDVLWDGEFHLYVDIWVINRQGKILLTLRSPDKDTAPSKWENTGGSVIAGERPRDGAVRELYEETGIKVNVDDLVQIGNHTYNHTISYIYLHLCKNDDMWIKLEPSETVDYIWVDFKDVKEMIENNKLVPEIKEKFYSLLLI